MKKTEFTISLRVLRKDSGLSLSSLAKKLEISAVYLSDLEKGNRNPSDRIVESLISYFKLNEEQKIVLYDAVIKSTNKLPKDVVEFLRNNPEELQIIKEKIEKAKRCSIAKSK
jgi:Predicted transcriptional regulator with C-terminal CBS domains